MTRHLTDAEWIAAWQECGASPTIMAQRTGIAVTKIYKRRNTLERGGAYLPTNPLPGAYHAPTAEKIERNYAKRTALTLETGCIVVFSDAHWWPGLGLTVAHRALLKLIKRLKPAVVIANGDIFDGGEDVAAAGSARLGTVPDWAGSEGVSVMRQAPRAIWLRSERAL